MATTSVEHSIVSTAKKVSSFRNLRFSKNEEGRELFYSSGKGKEKDLAKDVKKIKNVLCHFLEFKFKNSDLYKDQDWLEHLCPLHSQVLSLRVEKQAVIVRLVRAASLVLLHPPRVRVESQALLHPPREERAVNQAHLMDGVDGILIHGDQILAASQARAEVDQALWKER